MGITNIIAKVTKEATAGEETLSLAMEIPVHGPGSRHDLESEIRHSDGWRNDPRNMFMGMEFLPIL